MNKQNKLGKWICWLLAIIVLSLLTIWGIGRKNSSDVTEGEDEEITMEADETVVGEGAMSYEEYIEESVGYPVIIDGTIKEIQPLTDGKVSMSLTDEGGSYLIYEMVCTEAEFGKLAIGKKVCIYGYKGEENGQAVILNADMEFTEE